MVKITLASANRLRWGAEEIAAVATALNGRPRKVLGWRRPAEAGPVASVGSTGDSRNIALAEAFNSLHSVG